MSTQTIDPTTITTPGTTISIEEAVRLAFAPNWNVILWNDAIHTFANVIDALCLVLGISPEDAHKHAEAVHTQGKSIVASTTQEKAELYAEGLKVYGLTVTIESND